MQESSSSISKDEAKTITSLMDNYFIALGSNSWHEADKHLDNIIHYQKLHGSQVIPNQWKIKAEILFNSFNIFERLTPIYLIIGLTLLVAIFLTIFKPEIRIKKLTTLVLVILIGAFFVHTFGLGLRWYVSGHAPWSNGYESMIYIAWAIALAGILFSRQSILALSTTGILAGVTLFVAHLSWLEPQITTLTPVLKSYWLTIHVSVITASYGFLALSALLGFITLIFFSLLNPKNENHRFFSLLTSIKEARRINEMSMMVGLVLLVIGNFLGGIWANESWGRYWSWDPKETWTLISIIIYAIILHLHYIRGLNSNYIFASLSLVSFSSIVMTYFGVNYYLAGMHSYAAGDPIPIPSFVPISAAVILLLVIVAKRNSKLI